jgi:hypothetical protein
MDITQLKVRDKLFIGSQELTNAVTSVSGTGTVAGITLSGTVTTSGDLTLGGTFSAPISSISDATTVGQNLVKLTNPSAIRFIRLNVDNTVSALSDTDFRTAISAEPANANIQSHISSTSNPHSVTATQVGLGNVTNESKATMFTSPTFTGTVTVGDTIRGSATLTLDPAAHGDNTGKVIILGDLQVDGTTTTINSTTLDVDDKNITVSKGAANKTASDGGGLSVDLGTDGTANLTYHSTPDAFSFDKKLGIGTNNPAYNLSIAGASATSQNLLLTWATNQNDAYARIRSQFSDTNATVGSEIRFHQRAFNLDGSYQTFWTTNADGNLLERLRINHNGNVGINTDTPTANLHIGGAGARLRVGPDYPLVGNGLDRDFIDLVADGSDTKIISPNERFHIENTTGILMLTAANGVGVGTTVSATTLQLNSGGNIANAGGSLGFSANSGHIPMAQIKGLLGFGGSPSGVGQDQGSLAFYTRPITGNNESLVERMRITDVGNVGIGTASPAFESGGGLLVYRSDVARIELRTSVTGDGVFDGAGLAVDGTNDFYIFNKENASNVFITNSTERMRITGAGNVGIGTTTPGQKLTLPHSSNIGWEYGTSDSGEYTTIGKGNGGVPLAFKTTWTASAPNKIYAFYGLNSSSVETELLTILNGGNVGIGIDTPGTKLQVNQNVNGISDILTLSNNNSGSGNIGSGILFGGFYNPAKITAYGTPSETQGGNLIFHTASTGGIMTERVRITQSGNVGIGISDPGNRFVVQTNMANSMGAEIRDETNTSFIGLIPRLGAGGYNSLVQANDVGIIFSTDGNGDVEAARGLFIGPHNNTNNSAGIRILESGRVGIGVANPQAKLHIIGTGNTGDNSILYLRDANATSENTSYGGIVITSSPGNDYFIAKKNVNTAGYLVFGTLTGNTDIMTLTGSATVGIGTNSPGASLDIRNAGGTSQRWSYDAASYWLDLKQTVTSGNVRWNFSQRNNNVNYNDVLVLDTGKVGFGTAYPGYTVDVVGDVNVSGNFRVNGVVFTGGGGGGATATVTTTSTTQTELTSFSASTHGSGRFVIQAKTGTDRQTTELLVTHDGTTAIATQYATIKTGNTLFTTEVDISGGNVRILVTAASATSTVFKTTYTLVEA